MAYGEIITEKSNVSGSRKAAREYIFFELMKEKRH